VPPNHQWYSFKAKESYRKIHEWLRSAFLLSNIQTELSIKVIKDIPGQCFIGAEELDLLWHGKKIAGAAQRRNKKGLLVQGSVQLPIDYERERWHLDMLAAGRSVFGTESQDFDPPYGFEHRVTELSQKYASEDYNQQR
jgi:lipoyl(octanoyl) transferase